MNFLDFVQKVHFRAPLIVTQKIYNSSASAFVFYSYNCGASVFSRFQMQTLFQPQKNYASGTWISITSEGIVSSSVYWLYRIW